MNAPSYRTPSGKVGRVVGHSAHHPTNEAARVWLEVAVRVLSDGGGQGRPVLIRAAYHPTDLTPAALEETHDD